MSCFALNTPGKTHQLEFKKTSRSRDHSELLVKKSQELDIKVLKNLKITIYIEIEGQKDFPAFDFQCTGWTIFPQCSVLYLH